MAKCHHCGTHINPNFAALGQSFVVLDDAFDITKSSLSLSDSGVGAGLREAFRQQRALRNLLHGPTPPKAVTCYACETELNTALDTEIDELATRISGYEDHLRDLERQERQQGLQQSSLSAGGEGNPLSASIANLLQRPPEQGGASPLHRSSANGLREAAQSSRRMTVSEAHLIEAHARARRDESDQLDLELLGVRTAEEEMAKAEAALEASVCGDEWDELGWREEEAALLSSCEGVRREQQTLNLAGLAGGGQHSASPPPLGGCFEVSVGKDFVTVNGWPLETTRWLTPLQLDSGRIRWGGGGCHGGSKVAARLPRGGLGNGWGWVGEVDGGGVGSSEGGGGASGNAAAAEKAGRAEFGRDGAMGVLLGWNEAASLLACVRGSWGLPVLTGLSFGPHSQHALAAALEEILEEEQRHKNEGQGSPATAASYLMFGELDGAVLVFARALDATAAEVTRVSGHEVVRVFPNGSAQGSAVCIREEAGWLVLRSAIGCTLLDLTMLQLPSSACDSFSLSQH